MKNRRTDKVRYAFPVPDSDGRLRNLILYIADKCASDKYFGAVKLNKILFWSDFIAYAAHEEPVTGGAYFAHQAGPVSRRIPAVKEQMFKRREIAEQVRTVGGGYTQRRIVASEKADLSAFSGQQIAIVDTVIEEFRRRTASDVSWRSHGRAWRIAHKAQSEIPYEAVFLSNATTPTEYQKARGLELIEQHGWGA